MYRKKFISMFVAAISTVMLGGSVTLQGSSVPVDYSLSTGICSLLTPDILNYDNIVVTDEDLNIEWQNKGFEDNYKIVIESDNSFVREIMLKESSCILNKNDFDIGEVYEIHVEHISGSEDFKEGNRIRVLFVDDNFEGTGSTRYDTLLEVEKPIILGVVKEEIPIILNRTVNDISLEEYSLEDMEIAGVDIYGIRMVEEAKLSVEENIPITDISSDEKWSRVFPDGLIYHTPDEALPHIVTVEIPAWNIDDNGEKYATSYTLNVHENLAEEVVQIFTEIFEDEEKFPIKSIGGWRWSYLRSGRQSQHTYGTCIDINPHENYMIYTNGMIGYQGYWRPYEDPYSITPDGSVIRVFRKYGWGWGGSDWNSSRDYMHLTYLGG